MFEDEDTGEIPFEDDSDLPCEAIIAHVLGSDLGAGVISTPDGNLMSTVAAESLDRDETEGSAGEGKVIPLQYDSFWRHNDRDALDCEDDN
ncbi:hypothetical protein PILCRDRAFT_829981 [Piloderma croceum F 1598]|uniref:Uncharacterized protein n=1 Tax=Piloderma croceum (strain F 1598) TaxID=765440 RepID=A0A0C3EVX1_PILCF|nr:hypothetical protein PILCRDRAFT_829981 [Piloderma croceum F 1598]